MSNSATPQLLGSSESTHKKTLQWQANTKLEVYYMSIPGSRNQKFEKSASSVSVQAAINKETPNISRPQVAASSLKLNQATATSRTITGPAQITTSLPVPTDPIPAPQSDVNHEQSSTVKDDKKQRVCNTCKSKYEKEENRSDVEEWLYSDTCTNCRNVILSHHRSISRLQSPKHHKTTNHDEEPHSCCCF